MLIVYIHSGHPKKKCLFGIATLGFTDPGGREEFFLSFKLEVQLKIGKQKNLHIKKKVVYFLLIKFYQRGYFNEAKGNSKQLIILFWPQMSINIYKIILLSVFKNCIAFVAHYLSLKNLFGTYYVS